MALVGKGVKAAGAVILVTVLSVAVIYGDFADERRIAFTRVYAIGAAAGLVVSLAAVVLMKRKARHLRFKNLALTLGALFGGAALLSVGSVSETVLGARTEDTGMLLLNYALGYLMIGVTLDALRVFRTREIDQKK